MLEIPEAQFEVIVAEGRAGKPLEICGLLGGRRVGERTVVVHAIPVQSDDASPLTYTLNATGYIQAVRKMEREGLEVVGIYHTHPATVAYPSITDVARAHWGDSNDLLFPDYSYLIVSLRNPEDPEPHSFKITGREIPQGIVEEEVVIV